MLAVLAVLAMSEQNAPTIAEIRSLIAREPFQAAEAVKRRFKPEDLAKGAVADDFLDYVFAVQTTGKKVTVTSKGKPVVTLTNVGDGLNIGAVHLEDGQGYPAQIEVDGKVLRAGIQVEGYSPNPYQSTPKGGLKGELRAMGEWKSKIYPGTTRQWYIYLPPGYTKTSSYPLLVCQDAQWDRQWHAAFLDNMRAAGKIPPVVGVFIEPGQDKPGNYSNRSQEYDPLNNKYVTFLEKEILPEVEKIVGLSHDPKERALTGNSSGGICSFTACWERPDLFGTAISFIGSFADIASGPTLIEGGHNYPFLIRKSDNKPIRVFLQDGANDLDNIHGSWWVCNQQMMWALRWKGYDYVWAPGNSFHSTKHARRVFDQALEWWLNGTKPTKVGFDIMN